MTLAKSSLEIAEGYLGLVPAELEPVRFWSLISEEHAQAVAAVLAIVEARRLLDRHRIADRLEAWRASGATTLNLQARQPEALQLLADLVL